MECLLLLLLPRTRRNPSPRSKHRMHPRYRTIRFGWIDWGRKGYGVPANTPCRRRSGSHGSCPTAQPERDHRLPQVHHRYRHHRYRRHRRHHGDAAPRLRYRKNLRRPTQMKRPRFRLVGLGLLAPPRQRMPHHRGRCHGRHRGYLGLLPGRVPLRYPARQVRRDWVAGVLRSSPSPRDASRHRRCRGFREGCFH